MDTLALMVSQRLIDKDIHYPLERLFLSLIPVSLT